MQLTSEVKSRREYSGADIALLVPTRNRPEKLEVLLTSLARQTQQCGRILVIDGGVSVEHVVRKFKDQLPVEYYVCQPPGQIRQKNLGISKLDENTSLVGFIDDKILLEPDAIEKMLDFWNLAPVETAGVSFNNVSAPVYRHLRFLNLFFMSSPAQGKVTKSAYNTSIGNVKDDIRSEWLCGGGTIWRLNVVRQFPQKELKTKWAIGEDVRFSYPIGRLYPLFVSSKARLHIQVEDGSTLHGSLFFRGEKSCLSYYFFASTHSNLSKLACYWMLTGKSLAYVLKGMLLLDSASFRRGAGYVKGLAIILCSEFGIFNIQKALED